jgi:hypothetical protein
MASGKGVEAAGLQSVQAWSRSWPGEMENEVTGTWAGGGAGEQK